MQEVGDKGVISFLWAEKYLIIRIRELEYIAPELCTFCILTEIIVVSKMAP